MSESVKKAVVLAVDGSEHAERALEFYLSTLYREGHEVQLVHALEYPYVPAQPYAQQDFISKMFDEVRKNAQKVEEHFRVKLTEKRITFKIHSEFGHPGEMICRVCTEQEASMVVLGTRGMGTLRRTLMGSVSDYVVHHAHCPVVIVRQ